MKDTLFAKYLLEREGFETYFHEEKGFMTFRAQGPDKKEFFIRDMYVSPDFRRTRSCWDMADRVFAIARNRGCKYVAGTVYTEDAGGTLSLQAMLAYGFKIQSAEAGRIVLTKGL